jgi:UPF0755 protein
VKAFFSVLLVVLGLAGAGGLWWVNHPMTLNAELVELTIEPGTPASVVAQSIASAGVRISPKLLYWWFRISGSTRQIKAGDYEISQCVTPLGLLRKLRRGEEIQRSVTLLDGMTFNELRIALSKADHLRPDSQGMSDSLVMEKLGRPKLSPEGRFFPDTYNYAKGSSDLEVLLRAMKAMDQQLDAAWQQRAPDLALKTAEDALILASIVEKETGRTSDRAMISAVFNNRLRKGMLLQTDPTVIFGLGRKFDGNLRKRDLKADTPWNTYTRAGLPPTPIAIPGKASLLAAVQPAQTKALYFVARGDGTSEFSATLQEHNRAVNKFQLGK